MAGYCYEPGNGGNTPHYLSTRMSGPVHPGQHYPVYLTPIPLSSFGIKHRTSSVYAPHCNPVERANRTIKTMVAQYVGDQHRDWDQRIDALQFAITARHEATGYSPAFLVHGRELAPSHPVDRRPAQDPITPETHRQGLEGAYEVTRIHLARTFQTRTPLQSPTTRLAPMSGG